MNENMELSNLKGAVSTFVIKRQPGIHKSQQLEKKSLVCLFILSDSFSYNQLVGSRQVMNIRK